MANTEIPVSGHLAGTGSQELRNLRLWMSGPQGPPSAALVEGTFWYDSDIALKAVFFRDNLGPVKVPRLDKPEVVSDAWTLAPPDDKPPFYIAPTAHGRLVTGLNAERLGSFFGSQSATGSTVAVRDSWGRLSVAPPVADTEAVNKGYLTTMPIDAGQITTGLLALQRGGTFNDLSGAPHGGIIYKAANNLASTTPATLGVVVAQVGAAPIIYPKLPVIYGGTGGSSLGEAQTNLGVLSADTVRGLDSQREPMGGLMFNGVASWLLRGHSVAPVPLLSIGLSDFTISCVVRFKSYAVAQVLFYSHIGFPYYLNFSTVADRTFALVFSGLDGSGGSKYFTLTPDVPLVDGETYTITVSVKRNGLATLYINGSSDRDGNGTKTTVDVSSGASWVIGNGNATTWGAGHSATGIVHAIRFYNYALSDADAMDLAQTGTVAPADQWGAIFGTNVIDGTLLNGGFETAGAGGADAFANWGEGANGASVITRDTTDFHSGTACLKGVTDAPGNNWSVWQVIFVAGMRYRISFWAKGTVGKSLKLNTTTGGTAIVYPFVLTAAWTFYTIDVVAQGTYIVFSGSLEGAATYYLDDVTVTRIGAVMDLDMSNAVPGAKSETSQTDVKDRSPNNYHGVISPGVGTTQVKRTRLFNSEHLLASGLALNSVVYAAAGGLLSSVPVNAGAMRFLTQTGGGSPAPTWTDLFGGSNVWTGTQNFQGADITVRTTPLTGLSAVNRDYVQSQVASGFRNLAECRVATTANIALTGEQTIDGVLTAGNRVLVKNQTAPAQNGIYVSAAGAWVRSTDCDIATEITVGAYTFIKEGTTNANTSWSQTAAVTTINTDPVIWQLFSRQASYTAGLGIAINGLQIAVDNHYEFNVNSAWTKVHQFNAGIRLWNSAPLRFYGSSSTSVGFKAPATISEDVTWTLPSVDGTGNQFLKSGGGGLLSFAQVKSVEVDNSDSRFATSIVGTSPITVGQTGAIYTVGIAGGSGLARMKWVDVPITGIVPHGYGTTDVVVRVIEKASPYRSYDLIPTTRDATNIYLEFTVAPLAGQFKACVMAAY